MDALDMLTEDCWIEVFRKVVSAVDLKACSETCLLFETIVNRRKPSWKLGVIFPFLVNYLNLEEELQLALDRWSRTGIYERPPFWRPVLRTRLVSSTLCHAVDSYLEANLDSECYPHRWRPASYFFCQEREEKIDEFIQIFETHHGNPFIGRKVTVVYFRRDHLNRPEQYNENDRHQESLYMGKLVQFLNTFGHHLWTFDFFEVEYCQHLRFCKALQLLLSHLPNLKNLSFQNYYNYRDNIDRLDERDRREGMDELTIYLTTHPLPALPHLESLHTRGLSIKMGQPLVETYAPHLKSLRMHDYRPFFQCVERFNCLKELNLDADPRNTFEELRKLQSPLEKLSIKMRLNTRNPRLYDMQEFFRNVRHLPLKDLKIDSDCFIGESVPISPDLQIESIRKLHILRQFTERLGISFNFLLCLTKLEEVKLSLFSPRSITSPHPSGLPEQLFVIEPLVTDDLYSSDIWERIPSLKKFSFNYRAVLRNVGRNGHYRNSYSRHGYEEWRLNKTEKFFASN